MWKARGDPAGVRKTAEGGVLLKKQTSRDSHDGGSHLQLVLVVRLEVGKPRHLFRVHLGGRAGRVIPGAKLCESLLVTREPALFKGSLRCQSDAKRPSKGTSWSSCPPRRRKDFLTRDRSERPPWRSSPRTGGSGLKKLGGETPEVVKSDLQREIICIVNVLHTKMLRKRTRWQRHKAG